MTYLSDYVQLKSTCCIYFLGSTLLVLSTSLQASKPPMPLLGRVITTSALEDDNLLQDGDERISPFLPQLSLTHLEASIPITEQKSFKLYRHYASRLYAQYYFTNYQDDARNYTEQGWQLSAGYIVDFHRSDDYSSKNNYSNPVYIKSDGQAVVLYPQDNTGDMLIASQKSYYKTKSKQYFTFANNEYTYTDKDNTRYYFSHRVGLLDRVDRYYLKEIIDPSGNRVIFNYHPKTQVDLLEISASDGSEIKIEYQSLHIKGKLSGLLPKKLYFNDSQVVEYKNGVLRSSKLPHSYYILEAATYFNGEKWQYEYGYVDVVHHGRGLYFVLTQQTEPSGRKLQYSYHREPLLGVNKLEEIYLTQKKSIEKNKPTKCWRFGGPTIVKYKEKPFARALRREIIHPSKRNIYYYGIHTGNLNRVWSIGLPFRVKEFQGNDSSYLQPIKIKEYEWTREVMSKQIEQSSIWWQFHAQDNRTYQPILLSVNSENYI